jgi:HAD superfamily hydrolase (TIGR01509 family)
MQKRPSMDAINTILFDWDGTIVDSASVSFEATQKSLGDLGVPVTFDQYQKIYSPNWHRMYEALNLPQDKWKEAEDRWILHYGQEAASLVPGGWETLNELWRRGYSLGIVSSGNQSRVRREINAHELASVFKTVICFEDVVHKKPHPEGLELARKQMGKRAEDCCYVGDSCHDIEMGKRANMCTIAIRSQYPGGSELLSACPDFYFDRIAQLLEHFAFP